MPEQFCTVGDVELCYETFGDPNDPPLLLVNGLGSQCVNFRADWCERFVAAGFFTMRFDNRDVGRSTHFDGHPIDGLYAAGNAMAAATGLVYGGAGGTLGPAVVFGYRAGRHAAG